MNRQELIDALAAKLGLSKRLVTEVLEGLISTITEELKKGNNVTVTGFGTFRVSNRAARSGVSPRNPKQRIEIPALKVPAFRAGKTLKDSIR
ncbi:HU family DNA-binding protein [Candidatus Gracilibacteria bacterium]|nr:HU family DNA-binding protein [Candidatus Gracilibacteria bacterium]MCF7856573.1 HU family DNA-binding protein [Candidatus Gracilibacteria bacterium]MCF7896879.1 HU family DNA-binding protein [Candidatus Gracilibacteria bacterium]